MRADKKPIKMRIFFLFCTYIYLNSCSQKQVFFKIENLEEQEIKVYFNEDGYPQLNQDANGNYVIMCDTGHIIYTSTDFDKLKNTRNVYCFKNYNNKCFYEDYELEKAGFNINLYSNFTSDASNNKIYIHPFDKILIEKIKE